MPTLEQIRYVKENKNKICELYNDGYSSLEIKKILNISKSRILKTLKEEGVEKRSATESHTLYNCDENIFEIIDTHEKAYWVGFLTADATITGGSLKLALSVKDYDHLEKFRTFMKSNHPIHIYKQSSSKKSVIKNKSKSYYYGIIDFHNKKIVQDLAKYSITKNKSFTTEFGKNIPNQFINSYMAGLVDADGFITISNNKITIGFLSHELFAKDFNHELHKYIELPDNKLLNHHKNKKIKIVRYSGVKVLNIGEHLYRNTVFFLPRKKDKLLGFFH